MSSKSHRLVAISEDLKSITVQLEALQIESDLHDFRALSLLLQMALEEAGTFLDGGPPMHSGRLNLTVQ